MGGVPPAYVTVCVAPTAKPATTPLDVTVPLPVLAVGAVAVTTGVSAAIPAAEDVLDSAKLSSAPRVGRIVNESPAAGVPVSVRVIPILVPAAAIVAYEPSVAP